MKIPYWVTKFMPASKTIVTARWEGESYVEADGEIVGRITEWIGWCDAQNYEYPKNKYLTANDARRAVEKEHEMLKPLVRCNGEP